MIRCYDEIATIDEPTYRCLVASQAAYVRRRAFAVALSRSLRVFRGRLRAAQHLGRAVRPDAAGRAQDHHRFAMRRLAVQLDRAAVRSEELARIIRRRAYVAATTTKGTP